ncbi:MAG: PQQ-binding-like beta-propeller repeat protein [Candidatus Acidiferrales bacterium]
MAGRGRKRLFRIAKSGAQLAALFFFLLPLALKAQGTNWEYPGSDPESTRFSPLTQINPHNVTKLVRAWTFHTGGEAGADVNSEGAPLVVDGVMYFDAGKNVFALDPDTGKLIWKYETKGTQRRGLAYWPGDATTGPRLFLGVSGRQMLGLDAKTGKPAEGFGEGGFVTGVAPSSAPVIYHDLIITGENGVQAVKAWDARTGKLVWAFDTKAQPGTPEHATWKGDSWNVRGGTDVWSFMTLDPARGIVYVPVAPTGGPDFYGGVRLGDTLFGDSVVALDANTGKLIWYRQLVHHDLWDWDVPGAPTLFDIKRDGKTIPGAAEFSKQGLLFMFNRVTGEPLFGLEERPVPQTDVPGDETSPTQPFPLKPPPLAPMNISKSDLYTLTPEHAEYCRNFWDENHLYNLGPFMPYSMDADKMAVIFPGREGSGNWAGVAFDPKLGYLFGTTAFNAGQTGRIVKADHPNPQGGRYDKVFPGGPSRYGSRFWDPKNGWPCIQPPWAEIFAVNAKTGDIVWRKPFGTVDALAEKGFPDTGAPNTGPMIVTASGLIFIGATNDGRFRAFDVRTGKTLWTEKIDASAHTLPATYTGKSGKQYVVVEAFGGPGIVAINGYFNDAPGDSVIAFALP